MASRTAEISLGVSMSSSRSIAGRVASFVSDVFFTGAPFASGGGITTLVDLRNLRRSLPTQKTPLVDANGCMTPDWYKFVNFVINVMLGGINAPTLAAIANNVTAAQVHSILAEALVNALTQMAQQNAQILEAMRQVQVAAALPGATQITVVQLAPQPVAPSEPTGGE